MVENQMNDLYLTWRTSLSIAYALCIVIGQLHADKCDYHAIYRWLNYVLTQLYR